VVGFQHRMGVAPGDDEHFGWSEYLLYNQKRGFAFLVDSDEGWSLVRPTTGAPQVTNSGLSATYLGVKYQHQYSYQAETTYVLGEFYWPVERGQTTFNRDFANAKGLLSMEQSASELTWSSGDRLPADTVAKAFGLEKGQLGTKDDVGPFVANPAGRLVKTIAIIIAIIVLLSILDDCSSGSGGGFTRSSGGSFGGYSTGGGHK
jgi:hypothetical protein